MRDRLAPQLLHRAAALHYVEDATRNPHCIAVAARRAKVPGVGAAELMLPPVSS